MYFVAYMVKWSGLQSSYFHCRILLPCAENIPPEMFLGNNGLKICCKFTAEDPGQSAICWKRTSAWVFSCKFAAYFQNIFSLEHLWRVTSGCEFDTNFKWKPVNMVRYLFKINFTHCSLLNLECRLDYFWKYYFQESTEICTL